MAIDTQHEDKTTGPLLNGAMLIENDALFRVIYEDSPIGIVIFDAGGQMIHGNHAVRDIFGGQGASAVIPLNLFMHSAMPAEQRVRLFQGRSLRAEVPWDFDRFRQEASLVTTRKGKGYLDIQTAPLFDPISKKIIGFISQIQDVTDRKMAEVALRGSGQMLQTVLENYTGLAFWKDRDSVYLGCNKAFARINGKQSPAELIGKTDADLGLPGEAVARYRTQDLLVIEGRQPKFSLVEGIRNPNGALTWFDSVKVPMLDDAGKIIGVVGFSYDITERKRAELALIRHLQAEEIVRQISSRFLQTDAGHLSASIDEMLKQLGEYVGCDRTGVVLFSFESQNVLSAQQWSLPDLPPKAELLVGLRMDQFEWGRSKFLKGEIIQFNRPDDLPPEAANEKLLLNQIHFISGIGIPLMLDHFPQGFLGFAQERAERAWDPDDLQLLAIVGESLTSLLARTRAEQSLRRLNEELEQRVSERTAQLEATNRELEAFTYSVSHDLRSPLRAVDGYSLALLEDNGAQLDELGKDYLARLRAANHRMNELVDDLLLLSRLTRSEFHREPVNLSEWIEKIDAELRKQYPQRQVTLVLEPGLIVQGDVRLLQLALENLMGNAWKFTSRHPQARIEFGSMIKNGKGVYFIKDDGAGFDMTYVHKLFGAFQRLHDRQEFDGTGIGLATVQRIIHRHGGEVWAEGAVEQGAVFYFSLGGN